jgi:hypothetical protein
MARSADNERSELSILLIHSSMYKVSRFAPNLRFALSSSSLYVLTL